MSGESFIAAARIGARYRGADVAHADEIAAIAESVVATVRDLSEEKLRDLIRNDLLRGRHPSWYEGDISEDGWRKFFFDTIASFWKWGHDFKPRLRVLNGGAS